MSKKCLCGRSLPLFILLCACAAAPAVAGGDSGQEVELRCKIVSENGMREPWRVQLQRSSGEPVRVVIATTGDTVRFKGLQPDVYVVCLEGTGGRQKCQSIDMVPPPDHKDHSFLKKLFAPLLKTRGTDVHRIKASQLEIPPEAYQEMKRSEEAQLRGDNAGALEHLNKAIKLYPTYPEALNNLGAHYRRQGDNEAAVKYFRETIRLDPDFYAGWANLGAALLSIGQFEQSLDACRHALELQPEDALANSQVALGYYYLRQYDEAKEYFEKVAELDPSFANSPQLYLAHIALAERRDQDAAGYFRQFLTLHPNSPEAPLVKQTVAALVSGSVIRSLEVKKTVEDK